MDSCRSVRMYYGRLLVDCSVELLLCTQQRSSIVSKQGDNITTNSPLAVCLEL